MALVEKYLDGFVPKNTLYELGADFAPRVAFAPRPPFTLDWSRKDWRKFYHAESVWVMLQHHNRSEPLDAVLVARGSRSCDFKIIYEFDRELFVVPKKTTEITQKGAEPMIGNPRIFNGCNLRLKQVQAEPDHLTLVVQPVLYHDYVRSNLTLDYPRFEDPSTLRRQIHPQGRLEDLAASVLANHIGINMLVFTASGKLIVPTRSTKAIFRAGEYTSSSSGTLEPADLFAKSHFAETHKELGLLEQRKVHEPLFLGLTRELVRGGQPELFFAIAVDQTEDEIAQSWRCAQERDESEKLECYDGFGRLALAELSNEEDRRNFIAAFDRLIDLIYSRAALPFLTNLALWRDFKLSLPA